MLPSKPHPAGFITRSLCIVLGNYAILSFLDGSLYAIYPLFLASPISSGGLNFTPRRIGYVLGTGAMCHGVAQVLLFAKVIERWEARKVFAASMVAFTTLFIMMPIMNLLLRQSGQMTYLIWGLIVLEEALVFFSYLAYGTHINHPY